MWNEFNIKTFPAETIVYRDGVFCPDLSTLAGPEIPSDTILPVHVIYVGEISGENHLNLDIHGDNRRVFLSVKIKNKFPAFLNIFIKNAGKNSEMRGGVIVQNQSELTVNVSANHTAPDTTILIHTRLIADEVSQSKLTGVAMIDSNAPNAVSDISFSAIAAPNARIEFAPTQRIAAAPQSADHSASIYHATAPQINYLRMAGLGGIEVKDALREAFENGIDLF